MIYLVTLEQRLFESEYYKIISEEESIALINNWDIVQVDSETSGRDAHICDFLSFQFGNDASDIRVVVDCNTIKIEKYKDILESKLLVLQNAKFDIQFMYKHNIIPRKIYDTMIVEQLLYLGYPSGQISYSLHSIAERRLNINIDKTVRGEIIWRGLDESVIIYGAGDVTYLEKIMQSQLEDLKKQDLIKAAQIENRFIPVIAYLEWCGIHLDETKWKIKMQKDKENLAKAEKELSNYAVKHPKLQKWAIADYQGDLFNGFNLEPKWTVDWQKDEALKVIQALGFNTQIKDKKTGDDKDSIMEKVLKPQKGIDDTFLKLYFDYQEYYKVCSSFGQGHLNAINPITNRIHTVYKQLGCASGRMSCGSQQSNSDLAKLKHLPEKECTYPNMQQLPADETTRGSFTAPEGYLWSSCDYSA